MSQEGKGARVEVRWMLGREENGKNWERMEKNRKDRKVGNSDFIDSSGNKLLPVDQLRYVMVLPPVLYMLSGIFVV